MESKFVIGNVEPFIGGGLFIQIMFIDHPNDVYSAWVYSFVDHGVGHWDRVAQFGKMLYQEGADMDVILAFAYLHDSERINNSFDDEHGFRASLVADSQKYLDFYKTINPE